MNENLEPMFDHIKECVEAQLKNYDSDQDSLYNDLQVGGSASFSIRLDGNGNGSYQITKTTLGVTVSATAKVVSPEGGIFNIHLESNGGTSVNRTGLKTGESMSCDIKTKFWGKTTIKVTVHSSIPNTTLMGRLDYSL